MSLSDQMKHQSNRPKNILKQVLERFLRELDTPTKGLTHEWLEQQQQYLQAIIDDEGIKLSAEESDDLWQMIVSEVIGFGPLDPLLADPTISEIVVLRYDAIYVVREGKREKFDLRFDDDNHMKRIGDQFFSGDNWDTRSPVLSTRLKDGTIVTYLYPNEDFIRPLLIIHKVRLTQSST